MKWKEMEISTHKKPPAWTGGFLLSLDNLIIFHVFKKSFDLTVMK